MKVDSHVQLHWDPRTVALHDVDGLQVQKLAYPGITLTWHANDDIITVTWVPVGQSPTFSDDEVLIAALHTAWRWSQHTA